MSSPLTPPSETSPVRLTSGLPETVLPDEPAAAIAGLAAALSQSGERRRQAVANLVRLFPTSLAVWAALAASARDDVEAYACSRVGYHRGLDALRAAGWKGSGLVRWEHPGNQPFLRCVESLRASAAAIGERSEEERCALFLRQLDPSWPPDRTGSPA